MPTIRNIANYPMSEDYELLFELAQNQSVVCEVSYHGKYKDVAQTLFTEDWFEMGIRGLAYFTETTKDDFIKQCRESKVRFIVPNNNEVNA